MNSHENRNELSEFIFKKVSMLTKKVRIALIDGADERTYQAANELKKVPNLEVTIIHEGKSQFRFERMINIQENVTQYNQFVDQYVELRRGKETKEQAQKVLKTKPYYTLMLLKNGFFDGVVGGLSYPSADILRSTFKVIGPKPGVKTISSVMLLAKGNDVLAFADISINISPDTRQLVDIANNATDFLDDLGYSEVKPAFMSFSTQGSAVTPESKLVADATVMYNQLNPHRKAIGEVQFDAAYDINVRKLKYQNPEFTEKASLYIVPNLTAGNMSYKVAQRLGGYSAFGPIVVGTKKAVNDLSRGATIDDVVNTVLVTAIQASGKENV